jgi:hypothetical protein
LTAPDPHLDQHKRSRCLLENEIFEETGLL